ncbi:hypothetical protein [uncultured Ilyobacter sp.]|uniref:hypothetical protein n=1 Tax=uncultured Ilyobacter sp. TaxID=544433 RepID=UPI002AA66B10|nr:hypothetical protein [uncultured Ilyobacter sp.]
MIINFECGKCKKKYDYNVKKICMENSKVVFRETPICTFCGEDKDYFLSEKGQGEMTELMFEGKIKIVDDLS